MNVILIVIDSLRKDHVGAYGNGWIQTPNLDALAKDSLRFTRAYPESMPTIPARRAIHTGMRTFPFRNYAPPKGGHVLLYGWQPVPQEQFTLAEILDNAGYETLLVTDTYHQFKASMNFQRGFKTFGFIRGQENDSYRPLWMSSQKKLDKTLMRGDPDNVEGKMRQYFANTTERRNEEDYFAPQVFTRAEKLIEGAKEQSPFFMVIDCFDPHEPWDPPKKYVDLYSDGYDGLEPYVSVYGDDGYLKERELGRMKALYAAEVTMTDRWLGRFLEKVEGLGLMEDTMIVLLSDHGHALGEHGIIGKPPKSFWPENTDVPFLIRHPEGKGAGETSDYYASTHDVAPTILGALNVAPPAPMDGQDLTAILNGGEPESRPYFTIGWHKYVYARDDRYVMFSRNTGRRAQLYDLREDPGLRDNVAWKQSKVVDKMFQEYVLKDAGGPLPNYNI